MHGGARSKVGLPGEERLGGDGNCKVAACGKREFPQEKKPETREIFQKNATKGRGALVLNKL